MAEVGVKVSIMPAEYQKIENEIRSLPAGDVVTLGDFLLANVRERLEAGGLGSDCCRELANEPLKWIPEWLAGTFRTSTSV